MVIYVTVTYQWSAVQSTPGEPDTSTRPMEGPITDAVAYLEWSSAPGQSVRLRQPTWGSTILFFYSWGDWFYWFALHQDRWLKMGNGKFGIWFLPLFCVGVCTYVLYTECCIQKLGHRLNWLLVALLPSDTERKKLRDSGLRNLSTRESWTGKSAMWIKNNKESNDMGSLWTRGCDSRIRLGKRCGKEGGGLDHGTHPCCIIAASTYIESVWFAICRTDDNTFGRMFW